MNKLDMESKDIVKDNLEYIKERFPEAVTEENGELKLNTDSLIQSLSSVIIDDKKEKYELTWPGKKQAIVEGNTRTVKTLRPLKDKSVNFDKTENIYIEGDNLEALKILQESYLNKIKCIYIDPPYNTGNDFIYNDNFDKTTNEELIESGQIDELGNRLVTNNVSNGRFHSDWLKMIYPRLKLARNLLKEDGVIFISIGDGELANTIKICDEIFGERNFIATLPRISKKGSSMGKFFSPSNDYIVCYCKDIEKNDGFTFPQTEDYIKQFKFSDENGNYKTSGLFQSSLDPLRGCINQRYYIECPDGELVIPPGDVMPELKEDGAKVSPVTKNDKVWRWSDSSYIMNKGNLVFTKTSNSPLFNSDGKQASWNVYAKQYLASEDDSKVVPGTVVDGFLNSDASKELKELGIDFSFPKPTELIMYLLKVIKFQRDDIILDFFSGSATTAHAIYKMNAIDGGNRKYILIQVAENLSEKTSNYSDTCKTICDLAELRIRKSIEKIEMNLSKNIDLGFRVYKVDSSNMKDEFYMTPDKISQEQIRFFEDNIKKDRTPEDLLTQVLLNLGLKLDLPIEEKDMCGNKVFDIDDGELLACFDDNISIDIIEKIAEIKPRQVVFRDSSFATDQDKVNFEERLKRLSAGTKFNVL